MSSDEALYAEYENGVADMLSFIAGSRAQVERNVRLLGIDSDTMRQIDVLVTTPGVIPLGTTRVAIECKHWGSTVDVPDIQQFHMLVRDVGLDGGLMLTTYGISQGASKFNTRSGIRIRVLTMEELAQWAPPGTVSFAYEIPEDFRSAATRRLRVAGFRVATTEFPDQSDNTVVLQAFKHFGTENPSGEVQQDARSQVVEAIRKAGVETPRSRSNGITVGGGTPRHRWIQTTLAGEDWLKILAADESEVEARLDEFAERHLGNAPGVRQALGYKKPEGWPVEGLFPGWVD